MYTTNSSSNPVKLDDTDPILIYSGSWNTSSSDSNETNGTSHSTSSRGSSVQFTFYGTFVAVYGTVGLDTLVSAYTLDGTTAIYVARASGIMYSQLFYNSSTLSDGEHTLLVTEIHGTLQIDFISYVPSVSSSTSSSSPPSTTLPLLFLSPSATLPLSSLSSSTTSLLPSLSSSTTPPPSSLSSSTTVPLSSTLASPTVTPFNTGTFPPSSTGLSDQANSNNKLSVPTLALAGGAIGAFVLVFTLVFGMLYYRKRAKQLTGAKLLVKENILEADPSELDRTDPDAVILPFTRTYASSPSSGHGSPNMNMYPPGPAYPPSDYDHQLRRHPSTPIYNLSGHYAALQPGYSASSENVAGIGAGPRYGVMYHGGAHPDYPNASLDRLPAPQRRGSIESVESRTSLAYMSNERHTIMPLPPPLGGSPSHPPIQVTQARKVGFVVQNDDTPQLRQHEDGGVGLNIDPQGSSSQQQRVFDLPPVYKPNYHMA